MPLACSTPACPGLLVVVRFLAVHRCCVLGCCFPLKISLCLSCLHCVGLQHFGEQRALGSFRKSGCPSCFADASERGVSPRLEVGGSACLLCARSPGCGWSLFEARLSGYCVGEGGGQGSQPWVLSACLQHTDFAEQWGSGKTSAGRGFCDEHVAVGLQHSCMSGALGRRAISCGPPLLLFGVLLSSQQGSPWS